MEVKSELNKGSPDIILKPKQELATKSAAQIVHEQNGKFEVGKVYYISRETLKVANKQFKTVPNDYEMTLNENSIVEEASDEPAFIPETKFNFVPIDLFGPYVNQKELVVPRSLQWAACKAVSVSSSTALQLFVDSLRLHG